ncbi:MAG TPA: polynucleotide kinase-phosphatase [Gemmatimonadaceae bacterium]|nr:polynucleotide kinase-phosphatase [Gemmatimonadaceae bacterium]
MMKISIPELSVVVLIGTSGSGKSTFARRHFKPTEVLSSDYFRGLVSDDENDQTVTTAAFEVLHYAAAKRLQLGRLVVVDATNVQDSARKPLVELARRCHVIPVAIVIDVPERLAHERNQTRADRTFGPHVIRQQHSQLRRSLRNLQREGFRHVHVLRSVAEVDAAEVVREPLWNNRRWDHGPFDIIGDIHGCADELDDLLDQLGYVAPNDGAGVRRHPAGRRAVFVGDLVDRGPRIPAVLRTVMAMVEADAALCVPGNHDIKLLRKLRGRDVQITHGLADSLAQLEAESSEFRDVIMRFIDDLVSHYILDDGKLVVAHAGMKEEYQGRGSGTVRDFALFGETTGETDEFGLPVRYNWAAEYRGAAAVVYGHTPVPEPEWVNGTINIDTGCVFGGRLTALRWPERELVSVAARRTYAEPARPFLPEPAEAALSAQQTLDDVLDLADVQGKRIVHTRLHRTVTVREENATAALEVMSRFAVNPKWLIYLPPTMSPSETTTRDGLLEHPAEAFGYFRNQGVPEVMCQEKHMGSRAVVVVCRDGDVARRRFGITNDGVDAAGIVYTRTGRRFFDDLRVEAELLAILRDAMDRVSFWDTHATDWACLDCELMPWSAKAQELIRRQYAAVGAGAKAALGATMLSLQGASGRGVDVTALATRYGERRLLAERYVEAYSRYCWPVASVRDLRLAPFHVMATENAVHTDKDHAWHMRMLAELTDAGGPVLFTTRHRTVNVTDQAAEEAATEWWDEMTAAGGEGMVVKPMSFVANGSRGLVQPAVKCRGREYLRIIYGPEYTLTENVTRLRQRGLHAKRSLALREFALGIEALQRFVRHEPLRRVHECVFGVLALESEPVDPRL